MKLQCQSLDRISFLPQEDTIEKILTHMPIRDALRTSILSKKWRHSWTSIPKLEFDEEMANRSSKSAEINKHKLVNAIFHVLMLHRGPISELCIFLINTEIVDEIDQIIFYLSWSKSIKTFIFDISLINEYYKLPCSFFSLQGLEHIALKFCVFELPLAFNGFSVLKSLAFYEVKITPIMLQRFLTGCPLLEEFSLNGEDDFEFLEGKKCTFVELFKCLPSIQVLNISMNYIKQLTTDSMPQMLPNTSLVHLRILVLEVCLQNLNELSSTLFVIRSSPNLEKIKLEMIDDAEKTLTNLLAPQDYYSGLNLDHLKELEIVKFNNYTPEMEFVKLIMAKSPVLKRALLELRRSVSVDEENKMLRDFLLLPFPRASPVAKFIIKRPKIFKF